jgi:hypothetical protein
MPTSPTWSTTSPESPIQGEWPRVSEPGQQNMPTEASGSGSGDGGGGGGEPSSSRKPKRTKSSLNLSRAFVKTKRQLSNFAYGRRKHWSPSSSAGPSSVQFTSIEDLPAANFPVSPRSVYDDQRAASRSQTSRLIPPETVSMSSPEPTHGRRRSGRLSRADSVTSTHSLVTRSHVETTATAPSHEEEPEPISSYYPYDNLVQNVHRFGRYSTAAYGQQMMRILGIGKFQYNFPATTEHPANHHAFACHAGSVLESICLGGHAIG